MFRLHLFHLLLRLLLLLLPPLLRSTSTQGPLSSFSLVVRSFVLSPTYFHLNVISIVRVSRSLPDTMGHNAHTHLLPVCIQHDPKK